MRAEVQEPAANESTPGTPAAARPLPHQVVSVHHDAVGDDFVTGVHEHHVTHDHVGVWDDLAGRQRAVERGRPSAQPVRRRTWPAHRAASVTRMPADAARMACERAPFAGEAHLDLAAAHHLDLDHVFDRVELAELQVLLVVIAGACRRREGRGEGAAGSAGAPADKCGRRIPNARAAACRPDEHPLPRPRATHVTRAGPECPLTDGDDDQHGHPDRDALDPLPLVPLLGQGRPQNGGYLRRQRRPFWVFWAAASVANPGPSREPST